MGAPRARAQAWGTWLLFGALWAGVAFGTHAASPWQWTCLLFALGLGSWLILVRRQPPKLPVLNYHSVSARPEWLRIGDRVSITPEAFDRQLAYLKRHGYRSLFVSEIFSLLAGQEGWPRRSRFIALTFDDGFADNWIAAFPLLKKYGMKATIFVSTSFIAEADRCRVTIEETNRADWDALDWTGYLTWPELKAMRDSGLVEVQCHGHEHTRVFAGSGLKGFVGPGKPNIWLFWNIRPEARGRWWREVDADRSLWGHPVFAQAPALAERAFRPDPKAVAHMLSWARNANEFSTPDWERHAWEEWARYKRNHTVHGEWETDETYARRVEQDLTEARRILREKLGVESSVLCWPENAFSKISEGVARQVGFAATVSNRHDTTNAARKAPDRITRVFIGSPAAGIRSASLDFLGFVLEVKVFEGWYVLYPLLAAMHQARKIALAMKGRSVCPDYCSMWR